MSTSQRLSGHGLGMRRPHYADFLAGTVRVDFIEVISENFMVPGGRPRETLRRVRAHYPVALHGVSLSIGSAEGVDPAYLARLRALVDEVEPAIVSDHLCWTRAGGINSHDLLPLPYTEEALAVCTRAILAAQDALGRPMAIENPSSYLAFAGELSEWEFLAELVARTHCRLLLDVNNVHVSAVNHRFDPAAYLAGIPVGAVAQIHLAGHTVGEDLLIDTHDQPVSPAVWALYRAAVARFGAVPAMVERDDNIPELGELLAELDRARTLAAEALVPA